MADQSTMPGQPDPHCRIGKVTYKPIEDWPMPRHELQKPDLRSSFEKRDTHYDRDGYCDNPGRGF